MKNIETIHKLAEDALSSIEGIKRATVKPFLLTRIHARINKQTESLWEKAGRIISRPVVAFAGLCLIILINAAVIVSKNSSAQTSVAEQTTQAPTDEFSYTVATIYDYDNNQP